MNGNPSDQPNVAWERLPWKKIEVVVYRMQKRIFQASQRGDTKTVHKMQKLLMKSRSSKTSGSATSDAGQPGEENRRSRRSKIRQTAARLVWRSNSPETDGKTTKPVRRVWIPKPGKEEKAPVGIPIMIERACQALAKQALEPQWEAQFEPNSYGFRPGRSCHDAIEAIFSSIKHKDKFVFDADIKGAFDHAS